MGSDDELICAPTGNKQNQGKRWLEYFLSYQKLCVWMERLWTAYLKEKRQGKCCV